MNSQPYAHVSFAWTSLLLTFAVAVPVFGKVGDSSKLDGGVIVGYQSVFTTQGSGRKQISPIMEITHP